LSAGEQAVRVQRWAEIEDEAKLAAAVAGLPKEVSKQVADLHTTRQILRIQQVRRNLGMCQSLLPGVPAAMIVSCSLSDTLFTQSLRAPGGRSIYLPGVQVLNQQCSMTWHVR